MSIHNEKIVNDKSKFSGDGVKAIENSINSLVNFLDKLLKCIHDTLDQLEKYYQTYMSAVQTGLELNISTKTDSDQKKINAKYNYIKNQLEDFLTCIVKDYAEFIQDAYEIRTLHQQYDYHIDYIQRISLNNKQPDELDTLMPKVEKLKKQIDKIVLVYNADVTKLSYLKLNLRYRVIVYRSSFTGQSFSIPINVLLRSFKNLIHSNKLVIIANQIYTSRLEEPLVDMQKLSEEPELIYARSVNLDPLLVNVVRQEKQLSSAKPPASEPPRRKPPKREFPESEPSRQEPSGQEAPQPGPSWQEPPQPGPSGQEPPQQKLPRQEPPQVETPVRDMTTPMDETVSLETAQARKRSATSDESDETQIKEKRIDLSDETEITATNKTDTATTEDVQEDVSSMPSLEEELLAAQLLETPSTSSIPIPPQPRQGILKKSRIMPKPKQKQSRKIPMKAKKLKSKTYAPKKPIPELIAINKQKIITKDFYEKMYSQLEEKIRNMEEYQNTNIIYVNNELCKKYHSAQRELNNRTKDLERAERKMEEIRQSDTTSEKTEENLQKKEEIINKFKTIIVEKKLEIRRIQYRVQKLDKQDFDIQIYQNILYDIQRHLCQRWLDQLNKNLALETNDEILKSLRTDIRKMKNRIENIFSDIKDLHPSYILRKKRRMIVGPHKANFCIKQIIDTDILDKYTRKYGGKDYEASLANDPFAKVEEEEPVKKVIPPSAPINVLTPRRKPQ